MEGDWTLHPSPLQPVVGRDWLSPDTIIFLFLCFQDSELLTFNLSGHRSWWEEHGPGCLHEEAATAGLGALHGQSLVVGTGCAMVHSYVEALHSGLQILLAVSVGSGTQAGGLFYLGQSWGLSFTQRNQVSSLLSRIASISCKK